MLLLCCYTKSASLSKNKKRIRNIFKYHFIFLYLLLDSIVYNFNDISNVSGLSITRQFKTKPLLTKLDQAKLLQISKLQGWFEELSSTREHFYDRGNFEALTNLFLSCQ
jgi:hypothetical protein